MRSTFRLVAVLTVAVASTAFAQGAPAPGTMGPGPMAGGPPAAKLLLSNTGELGLTDQQVVRLAAIARRAEARRASIRAAMDSARTRFTPGDTAGRRQFATRMRAEAERAQEQNRVDQRDAIAVLNADQQAKAWSMVANRGRGMRGAPGRAMRGPRPMRGDAGRGMRRQPMPGMRDRDPGMRDRVPGARPMRPRDAVPARPPAGE
jgi:hypothetical protein